MGKKRDETSSFRIKQAQLLIFENITDRKMREAAEAGCNPTLKKKSCVLTKNYSQWNNHTIIRMIEFGNKADHPRFPSLKVQNCHSISRNYSWKKSHFLQL